MNPEVLPQKPLNLLADLVRLAPPETSSREHIEATLSYLEARMDSWSKEQDRRLAKAEKRVALCAYLHGFLGLPTFVDGKTQHFSWCPWDAWMDNSHLGIHEILGDRI